MNYMKDKDYVRKSKENISRLKVLVFWWPGGKHSKLCNCLPCKVVLVQTFKYRTRNKLASAIDAITCQVLVCTGEQQIHHISSWCPGRHSIWPRCLWASTQNLFAVASCNLCKLVEISNWQNLRTFEKLTNWHLADHVITIWPKMRQSKYRSLCIYQKLYILLHSKGCAVFLVNWFSIRLVRLHNMWRDLSLTEWKQTTQTIWCHFSPDHL